MSTREYYLRPNYYGKSTTNDTISNANPSGGEEVMLDVGGQDATEAFEDVGHSDEARETLDKLYVGELKRQVCPTSQFTLK